MSSMTNEDRNNTLRALLNRIDQDVKANKFDDALKKIRMVYQYDPNNLLARGYEERIQKMKSEQSRQETKSENEKSANQKIDDEVHRRLTDLYKQQELESKKREEAEKIEQALEERARSASVIEAQEASHSDLIAIEQDVLKRIEELERRLAARISQMGVGILKANTSGMVQEVRREYEEKMALCKKQFEESEQERKRIHEESFLKLKDEHQRSQDESIRQLGKERENLLVHERDRAKTQALDGYHALMVSMMKIDLPADVQASLLQSLRIPFAISEAEHKDIEHRAQLNAYIEVIRSLWQHGTPSEEELLQAKNLQQFYSIDEERHLEITKKVKKELGLPDDTAIIVVIDDDPAIRRYIQHILGKIYRTVIAVPSAEQAISEMQKTMPSLILSDVNLGSGVMSGFTFRERLLNGDYGEPIKLVPFIFMSAMADEFFIRSAQQLGIKKYLQKPFTREIIEEAIHKALL